jgi:hypothetical protein
MYKSFLFNFRTVNRGKRVFFVSVLGSYRCSQYDRRQAVNAEVWLRFVERKAVLRQLPLSVLLFSQVKIILASILYSFIRLFPKLYRVYHDFRA